MKILIFGSTYLSAKTCEYLLKNSDYHLIGYIPNKKRLTVPGKMPIPIVSKNSECDLILSIQYDQIIKNTKKSFNVHTGLLPEYGGVDILCHTLRNKAKEQGITFHKITKNIDFGPIISKTTYPVLPGDKIEDLYQRLSIICPRFVLSSLNLLENIPLEKMKYCYKEKPIIYKSWQINKLDEKYKNTKEILRSKFI